jgi:nucleotide-binding universal stress UspA family protein
VTAASRALRLLIATDGSENSARAVRHAVGLAGRGIRIEAALLNVQPPVLSGEIGAVATIEIAQEKRAHAADAAIAAARAPLEAAGIPVSVHYASGDPAEEIVAAAEALAADSIVMGQRGLGALASLILGSVSSQVARHAKVPVTLVP